MFTNFVPEVETRYKFGYTNIAFIGLLVLLNVVITIYSILSEFIRK